MNWSDQAIIISIKGFGENSAIVQVLSCQHGLFRGMVRNIKSAKRRSDYMIGNIVNVKWQARIVDHLGNFTMELQETIAAFILSNPVRLLALSSICAVLSHSLPERTIEQTLFILLLDFLKRLKYGEHWKKAYINLELELLSKLGFGVSLTNCAVSGVSEDLRYVSPKTGRAVSATCGQAYGPKLLTLPQFIINKELPEPNNQEMLEGLRLTGYFLNKHQIPPKNQGLPRVRSQLIEIISKENG
jgi:DNA repair protein RecO (recombination protein O)